MIFLLLHVAAASAQPAPADAKEAIREIAEAVKEAQQEGMESQLDCDNPQYQQEMNICAAREFEAADALLNAQWELTSEVMKQRDAQWDASWDDRPGYFDQLLAAQRAWIAFRDAHCASEGYLFRGGSMEPLLISTCMTKLTEERTAQLEGLIAVD